MRRLKDIGIEEIREIIVSVKSFDHLFQKLMIHSGPANRKALKNIINDNKIAITHFDKSWFAKQQRKHLIVERICPQCNKSFQTQDGGKLSKITCSTSCSNIYFVNKRVTTESKRKQKEFHRLHPRNPSLQKTKLCEICQNEFPLKDKKRRTCSNKCGSKLRNTPAHREHMSKLIKARIAAGLHHGWASRNIISYPEKYFKYRLDELKLKYEFNFPIQKKELGICCASCYFLDFYFPNIKLDLEIDGSQHKRIERKESDKIRDDLLTKAAITVFRIPWCNPINDRNKKILDEYFEEFLKIYKKLAVSGQVNERDLDS